MPGIAMTDIELPFSPSARAWAALGVQHAILARTMPVVRHDLAGMLTIMRMGAVVLRRRAGDAAHASTGDTLAQQLEQQEEHLTSLAESARLLRHWDLQGPHAPEPLAETAALARRLAYPLLAMRGLALDLPAEGAPALPGARAPQQPVLCLLLGAIHMLAEDPAGAPAAVQLQPLPGHEAGLRVQASGRSPHAPAAAATPGMPALDADALACLAEHVGAQLRCGAGWVDIEAPAATPPRPPPA